MCLLSGWLLLAASCADEPLPPPATAATSAAAAPVASLPLLPRSSIAAVVLHREELGLSDDQVRDLELRDQQREKEDAAVRDEVEEKQKAAKAAASAPSTSGGGGAGTGSGGPSGGMRGGGMGRRGARGGGASPPAHVTTETSIEERLDANDTKAYLDVESASLTEGQKDRAREIASEYREKLYERRELLRAQAAAK
jgi:hypothetical protein